MLSARLGTGTVLIAIFALAVTLDEPLAPWYPFWFLLTAIVMGATSLEVVDLLSRTSARPSGNTVFAGVLALIVANWIPHITYAWGSSATVGSSFAYDPSAPVHA